MSDRSTSTIQVVQGSVVSPEMSVAPPTSGRDALMPVTPEQTGQAPPSAQPVLEPSNLEIQAESGGIVSSMIDGVSAFVALGGPVVALLLILSVFALTITLLKFWQFYSGGQASNKKISAVVSIWLAQDYESGLAAMRKLKGPVVKVVSYVMAGVAMQRNELYLREEAEHLALAEIMSLRSYLRGLEAVVQVAPLLGLFGTVLGMIEAFRSLAAAGANVNPADLAGGIWVALLTTAVGLAVAMPVSLVLHWFEGRIDRVRNAMELFTTEVMTNPPSRAVTIPGAEGARVRLASAAEGKNAV